MIQALHDKGYLTTDKSVADLLTELKKLTTGQEAPTKEGDTNNGPGDMDTAAAT